MNDKLKPCPFCGGEAYVSRWCYKVLCIDCDAEVLVERETSDGVKEVSLKWNTRADGWISVEASLPDLHFESQEDPDEDGYPQFDGMVSQTVEITDGEGFGRGHLRSDGKWICYGAEYDMMIVDPEKVTHWAPLRQLPKAASCGE